MKQRKQNDAPAPASPFGSFLSVFKRDEKSPNAPALHVEKRLATANLLDEIASLDIAIATKQAARIEDAYARGMQPAPADVQLYAGAVDSVRKSVAEKARLLGTYGATAGKQDKDSTPTFRVFVSNGRLPTETGAEDADGEDLAVSEPKETPA